MSSLQERGIREEKLPLGRYAGVVDSIRENIKNFPTNKGHRYRHDIYFVMNDGESFYRAEYLTPTPAQGDFGLGEECCFEVTNSDGHVILKCGNLAPMIGATNGGVVDSDKYDPAPQNVSGRSYVFALGMSKDIAIAGLRTGELTLEDEHTFDKTVLARAWKYHQWLLNPTDPNVDPLPH